MRNKSELMPFAGLGMIVGGCMILLISLICFGIALDTLDTSYTNSLIYVEQVGLTDVISLSGLVLYILTLSVGLGAIVGGTWFNVRRVSDGDPNAKLMASVTVGVILVISLIMFTMLLDQIHALYY